MYSHDANSYSKLKEMFLNTLEKDAPLIFKTIEVIRSPLRLRN